MRRYSWATDRTPVLGSPALVSLTIQHHHNAHDVPLSLDFTWLVSPARALGG